jgi:serine/threonine protein kinase
VIAPNKKNMTGNVGTVSFIAPEVFENKPYDATADVYSFGMVMWGRFSLGD